MEGFKVEILTFCNLLSYIKGWRPSINGLAFGFLYFGWVGSRKIGGMILRGGGVLCLV